MGFGGGPWFVVKKDVEKNILYVSHGYDPETAYKQDFTIRDFHCLTQLHNDEQLPSRITFKIRHTPGYLPGTLTKLEEGNYAVHADAPIHGVAPGQFCVVYDEQHHRCYGSAEISI
jgi:tRNA-specific 2-thiouridylase